MSLSEKCVQTLLDTHITVKDKIKLGVMLLETEYIGAHIYTCMQTKNSKMTIGEYFIRWLEMLRHVNVKFRFATMSMYDNDDDKMIHFHTFYYYPQDISLTFFVKGEKLYQSINEQNVLCILPEHIKSPTFIPSITCVDEYADIVVPYCEDLLNFLIKGSQ